MLDLSNVPLIGVMIVIDLTNSRNFNNLFSTDSNEVQVKTWYRIVTCIRGVEWIHCLFLFPHAKLGLFVF